MGNLSYRDMPGMNSLEHKAVKKDYGKDIYWVVFTRLTQRKNENKPHISTAVQEPVQQGTLKPLLHMHNWI